MCTVSCVIIVRAVGEEENFVFITAYSYAGMAAVVIETSFLGDGSPY